MFHKEKNALNFITTEQTKALNIVAIVTFKNKYEGKNL